MAAARTCCLLGVIALCFVSAADGQPLFGEQLRSQPEQAPRAPIFLPVTSFWHYLVESLVPPSTYTTGADGLFACSRARLDVCIDRAYTLYRRGDVVASRANLAIALKTLRDSGDQRTLLRAVSLLVLIESKNDSITPLIAGGSRREPGPGKPVFLGERISQIRKQMFNAPPGATDWVLLFEGYQAFSAACLDDAVQRWRQVAQDDGAESLVRTLAWLGLFQIEAESNKGLLTEATLAPLVSTLDKARSTLPSALGKAQADLLEAQLRYEADQSDIARRLCDRARKEFASSGSVAGDVEVEVILALGELRGGQRSSAVAAVMRGENTMMEAHDLLGFNYRLDSTELGVLLRFAERIPAIRGYGIDSDPVDAVGQAVAFRGWADKTGNPYVELIALTALYQTMLNTTHIVQARFYQTVAEDLYARLRARVPLRVRLLQTALLDYDYLSAAHLLEQGRDPGFFPDATATAENLRLLIENVLPAVNKEEPQDVDAETTVRLAELKAIAGEIERSRQALLDHAKGGKKQAAVSDADHLFTKAKRFYVDVPNADEESLDRSSAACDYERGLVTSVLLHNETAIRSAAAALADFYEYVGDADPNQERWLPYTLGGTMRRISSEQVQEGDEEEASDDDEQQQKESPPIVLNDPIEERANQLWRSLYADTAPLISEVNWGGILRRLATETVNYDEMLEEAITTGGSEEEIKSITNSIGVEDMAQQQSMLFHILEAGEVAFAKSRTDDFLTLGRSTPQDLLKMLEQPKVQIAYRALAGVGAVSLAEMVLALPVSVERSKLELARTMRETLESVDSMSSQEEDDGMAESANGEEGKRAVAALMKTMMWPFYYPSMLYFLSGSPDKAADISRWLDAVQSDLEHAKDAGWASSLPDSLKPRSSLTDIRRVLPLNAALYHIATNPHYS